MVVMLQEDHELPLISGFARIRGGSREEPGIKAGLVSIYGQVWRTGGTKARTGDDLDDWLEARAATVETGGGLDSTSISFGCLKEDFADVFTIFTEVLRQPEFREDKIPLAKNQLNTGIARRNDDPNGIATREARRLAYGPQSPYARVVEYATVAAVTRNDLLEWHRTYVHPNNIVFGIVGDFDAKTMEATLRRTLASWPKGAPAKKATVAISDPKPGVYFVAKEDVNQSYIRMVHLGTTRDNPDYYALEVMNEVFGGSGSARLFSNIRTKKGLAYAVGGGVGMNFDHPGVFQLTMSTKTESTAAAIDALYEEIDNILKTPATAEELARAKESILNSFVFRFDSKQKVLSERMLYEFYGYPLDFLERYRPGIEKVAAEDVARVARKYIHREKVALLVVGQAAGFDKPLSTFGTATTVDITIPDATASAKPAAKGSDADAKALLAKVVEGLGGAEKLKTIKAVRQKGNLKAKTPQGEMEMAIDSVIVMPDRMRQQMTAPMGTMTLVFSPEGSFVESPLGTEDMPASQKESIQRELRTQPLYVAMHADDPDLSVRTAGVEKIGEVEARIIELNVGGAETKWYVDPASGRVLRTASRTSGMGPPAEQVVDLSDWRPIEGVQFAFKRDIRRNGEPAGTSELSEVQVNPSVDPKMFEKPVEAPRKP
jgi:zinc protease